MNAASRAPAEKDTRKIVIEIPTTAPSPRLQVVGSGVEPAVEGCGSVGACVDKHNIICTSS